MDREKKTAISHGKWLSFTTLSLRHRLTLRRQHVLRVGAAQADELLRQYLGEACDQRTFNDQQFHGIVAALPRRMDTLCTGLGGAPVFVAAALLAAACALPIVLWGSFAPLAAAIGYGLAVWYGFRQFEGMSGDISGFGLVLGELCGAVVLALGR